jgi:thioredoxin-like negative regulator of GroEL
MTGLTGTLLLQAAMLTTGAQPYEQAYKDHEQTGKPLLVLVGADWCPACVSMKNGTLANMERGGKLRSVAFSMLNVDRQGGLARKMMKGGSVPQLVLYAKTDKGWETRRLVGAQSEQAVQQMIGSVRPATAKVAVKAAAAQ